MQPAEQIWIVDVMEENSAAVEVNGSAVREVPRSWLPNDIREGDVCTVTFGNSGGDQARPLTIKIDRKATEAARARSAAQVASAPKSKDPGGPIKL